jgi:glycerol-3-phosphate acyltransferase PlsY
MIATMLPLLLCIFAFASGSFPSGLIVSRAFGIRDIRDEGSGNIGASNVATSVGTWAGIIVGVLDISKGILPVLIARWAGVDALALAAVGLCAVAGHDFSFWLRFKGGKGVATTFGVALAISPIAGGLALITWLASLAVFAYASVASLTALALLPVYMWLTHQPPTYVLLAIALFILATGKHWENIVRLVKHTEEPGPGQSLASRVREANEGRGAGN